MENQETVESFINRTGVKMTCKRIDKRPDSLMDNYSMRHFKCVLTKEGKRMTVYFSQGSAFTKDPTIVDVVGCLASDASSPDTFEDFCSEFGYDNDSITALKTFKAIQKQIKDVTRLFSDDYQDLLDTERL